MSKKISIIVPVYNAEQTLDELITRMVKVIENHYTYEIILVNDKSNDSSMEVIKNLILTNEFIIGIDLIENQGQQRATFIGMTHATGAYIIIIDDDLENNPEDIPLLIKEIQKGYDVVYAINENDNSKSGLRTIGSKLRDLMFRILTSIPKEMKVCSYRIISKKVKDKVIKSNVSSVYLSMEILKQTSRVGNVKVKYNNNDDSNYSILSLIKLYIRIITNYTWLSRFHSKEQKQIQYIMVGEKQCED